MKNSQSLNRDHKNVYKTAIGKDGSFYIWNPELMEGPNKKYLVKERVTDDSKE